MKKLSKMVLAFLVTVSVAVSLGLMPAVAEEPDAAGDAQGATATGGIWESYKDIDLRNWMTALPDSLPINQINIPGTHDSGTYHVLGGVSGFASTQECQIDKQLEYGIRCLDIRCGMQPRISPNLVMENLVIYHGDFPCYKDSVWSEKLYLTDVLGYCERFLKGHPGETIIIKLQADNHADNVVTIFKKMHEEYDHTKNGPYLYYRHGDQIPLLGQVRGKIVLIDNSTDSGTCTKYEDHYDMAGIGSKESYILSALDTSGKQDFLRTGDCWQTDRFRNEAGKGGEPVVKLVFTSNNALTSGAALPPTIWDFAKEINPMVMNYPLEQGTRYGWVLMDFPTKWPDLVKKIIYTNAPPECTLKFTINWQGGLLQRTPLDFYIEETHTGEAAEGITYLHTATNEITVEHAPVFKDDLVCDYTIDLCDIPNGCTYDVVYDGVDGQGTRLYSVNIAAPDPTHVKIIWRLCPGHMASEDLELISFKKSDDMSGGFENPIWESVVVYDEGDETLIDFLVEKAGYQQHNYIEPVLEEDSGYVYQRDRDFRRIDENNFEITIHAAGPYAGLSGTILYNDADQPREQSRRPRAGDAVWDGLVLVGRANGEVVTSARVGNLNGDALDSDGILTWKVEDAPLCTPEGDEIEWSVEYPDLTGYEKAAEGTNAVYTPVRLLERQGTITFDDNDNAAQLRPDAQSPIFKDVYLVGVTEDHLNESLKDVDFDFSTYESEGIISWEAYRIPEYYYDGQKLTWYLRIPEFDGYDAVRDDYNVTLSLRKHAVDVIGGTADCTEAACGTVVHLSADAAPAGQEFSGWSEVYGAVVVDADGTFVMPDCDVLLQAQYSSGGVSLAATDATAAAVPSSEEDGPALNLEADGGEKAVRDYNIAVENGEALPAAAVAGTQIALVANEAPEGMVFDKWEIVSGGVELDDETNAFGYFDLPEDDVVLRALYKEKTGDTYKVSITRGSADAERSTPGTVVTLTADEPLNGQFFREWKVLHGQVALGDAASPVTTLDMPEENVAIKAVYGFDDAVRAAYTITAGDGQSHTQKSGGTLRFTCDGDIEHFYCLFIDGQEASFESFDCEPGSTVATLKAEYLDSLGEGEHSIMFWYDDGESNVGHFTIAPQNGGGGWGIAATGDSSRMPLALALAIAAAAAATVILAGRKALGL